MTVIAVDWSGAKRGERRKISSAVATTAGRVEIRTGLDREETIAFLIEQKERNGELIVGLDFAFSMPRQFFKLRNKKKVSEIWRDADKNGEDWLSNCETPFWGRKGKHRPNDIILFRQTEIEVAKEFKCSPKSVFQINGPGAVGTGSIRGMPFLLKLKAAGFSIWPFDGYSSCVAVEIYPRLFTGALNKSNESKRRAHLEKYAQLDEMSRQQMTASEDSFDAGVSALEMLTHKPALLNLKPESEENYLLEGKIWSPPGEKK